MKTLPVHLVLVSLLLFPTLTFAGETDPIVLEGGPVISHIKDGSAQGILYGLRLAATYRPAKIIPLQAEVKLNYGEIDDTSRSFANSKAAEIPTDTLSLRFKAGYDLALSRDTTITPYLGLGLQHTQISYGHAVLTTGDPAPDQQNWYYYTPIGVQTKTRLNQQWSTGISVEYDLVWAARGRWQLSNISSSDANAVLDLDNGYGLQGTVRLEHTGDSFNFVLEPYLAHWHVAYNPLSYTLSGIPQPQETFSDNSTEIGLRLHFIGSPFK